MWYYERDLNERLGERSKDELVRLIVSLYNRRIPEVVRDEERLRRDRHRSPTSSSPSCSATRRESKAALEAEIERTKDKGRRVDLYFSLIERFFENADKLDHRYLSVSSACFGKAMTTLGNNMAIWSDYEERAREIAGLIYDQGNGTTTPTRPSSTTTAAWTSTTAG